MATKAKGTIDANSTSSHTITDQLCLCETSRDHTNMVVSKTILHMVKTPELPNPGKHWQPDSTGLVEDPTCFIALDLLTERGINVDVIPMNSAECIGIRTATTAVCLYLYHS